MESFHQRSQSCNIEISNFSLTNIIELPSFFQFFLSENSILNSFIVFKFLLMLINLHYFLLSFFFKRFFFTDFLHVSNLVSWNNFVQFTMLSQFIHNFEHIVFETKCCISLPFKVDFYDEAIILKVNPSNIAKLNVDLIVESRIFSLFLKSITSSIDKMKLVLVIRIAFQDKDSMFLN